MKTNNPEWHGCRPSEIYGLLASEYDYRAVDPQQLPYGRAVLELFRPLTKRLLHSYGAIQCLEKLLGLLAEGGFILVNDYGQTQITRDDEFEHQHFSLATFVGVNFSLLRVYFGESKRCDYVEPTKKGDAARFRAGRNNELRPLFRSFSRQPATSDAAGSSHNQCSCGAGGLGRPGADGPGRRWRHEPRRGDGRFPLEGEEDG